MKITKIVKHFSITPSELKEYLENNDDRMKRIIAILAKDCNAFHSKNGCVAEFPEDSFRELLLKCVTPHSEDIDYGITVTMTGNEIDYTKFPDNVIDVNTLEVPAEIRNIKPNSDIKQCMSKLAEAGEKLGWELNSLWSETKQIIEAYL